MNEKPESQRTEVIGTVEIPRNLRGVFLVVPAILLWVCIVVSLLSLPPLVNWADRINLESGCSPTATRCGFGFIVVLIGVFGPALVAALLVVLILRRKASIVADLVTDQLNLENEFRTGMRKRFSYGWSLFGRKVMKSSRRLRLVAPSSYPFRNYSWIISVTDNLSHVTVEKAPEGYLMPEDVAPLEESYPPRKSKWNSTMDDRIREMNEQIEINRKKFTK